MRRTIAAVGIAVGLAAGLFGYYLVDQCTWSFGDLCVRHDYSTAGVVMVVLGPVVAGTALLWLLRAAPNHFRDEAYCPVCGNRLRWAEKTDQWYCERCGQYRFRGAEQLPHRDT